MTISTYHRINLVSGEWRQVSLYLPSTGRRDWWVDTCFNPGINRPSRLVGSIDLINPGVRCSSVGLHHIIAGLREICYKFLLLCAAPTHLLGFFGRVLHSIYWVAWLHRVFRVRNIHFWQFRVRKINSQGDFTSIWVVRFFVQLLLISENAHPIPWMLPWGVTFMSSEAKFWALFKCF